MLVDEIRKNWESDIIGFAHILPTLKQSDYPAWTIKLSDGYGVAIPYTGTNEINEFFSNARIYSSDSIVVTPGEIQKVLVLTTAGINIEGPFSALCAEMIEPGKNGDNRKAITSNPVEWWKKWKELLGNRNIDERIYDVLGELSVLLNLVKSGEAANWNGPDGASYDIELDNCFVEVKSTLSKSKREITISNQFQLDPPGKPLNLVLCAFEPTIQNGICINSVVKELGILGYNTNILNRKLETMGFEAGMSARDKMFILHEMLRYAITPEFPRITPASFVGGVMPTGITKIIYTVDLSGLAAESMVQGANNDLQNN